MKLEKWALVAEVVGGIAIVLSLVFVGLQIRSSTQLSRAMAYERNIDSLNDWRLELIGDPELTSLLGTFSGVLSANATATEVNEFRLNLLLNVIFGVYEKSYFAEKIGIMGPDEWARFESQACLNRSRALDRGLWENMERLLTTEFASFLEARCA